MSKGRIVVATLIILMLIGVSYYLLIPAISPRQASDTVPSRGSIKAIGVEVYSDASCTTKLTAIDWGVLDPGASKNATAYVRNEGNSAITMSMSSANWNPSNSSQYLTLTWDYSGRSIAPKETLKVVFRLAVSSSISGITDFSFDITIVGTG